MSNEPKKKRINCQIVLDYYDLKECVYFKLVHHEICFSYLVSDKFVYKVYTLQLQILPN